MHLNIARWCAFGISLCIATIGLMRPFWSMWLIISYLFLNGFATRFWPMSRQIDWQETVPIWEANSKIVAAWAFGSAQGGVVREGGDVDTAVLTTSPLSFEEQLTLLGQLQT